MNYVEFPPGISWDEPVAPSSLPLHLVPPGTQGANDALGVQLLIASDIEMRPIHWLWLAGGKFHLVAGSPGTGKTTLAIELGAILSRGGQWPDGTQSGGPMKVVIWSGEDDAEDTIVPRLFAAGADLNNVAIVCGFQEAKGLRSFDPGTDLSSLVEKTEALGNVGEAIDASATALLDGVEVPADSSQVAAAGQWLAQFLANGPQPASIIREQGGNSGHAWRTMERAKIELKVVAVKDGSTRSWVWKIPSAEGQDCQDRQASDTNFLGGLGGLASDEASEKGHVGESAPQSHIQWNLAPGSREIECSEGETQVDGGYTP